MEKPSTPTCSRVEGRPLQAEVQNGKRTTIEFALHFSTASQILKMKFEQLSNAVGDKNEVEVQSAQTGVCPRSKALRSLPGGQKHKIDTEAEQRQA